MKTILVALLFAMAAPAAAAETVAVSKRQQSDGGHVLVHELVVDAPVASVWQAISTAEGWKSWAAPGAWVPPGAPDIIETSYSPGARPGDASTIRQQVIARVPEVLIVFRTVKAPERFPDFETYSKVTSVLQLEPAGEGRTRVRLTGAGYADSEAGRRLLAFFEKGNATALEALRTRFSSGKISARPASRLAAPRRGCRPGSDPRASKCRRDCRNHSRRSSSGSGA